jgi:hypothetical protein
MTIFLLRIRNVSDKSYREYQNAHFTLSNFFLSENRPVKTQCSKMWWSQRGHKWRHYIAHTRCMSDKQDYTHRRACTSPCTRENTHAHTDIHVQGGSNMTGTNFDLFTHKSSRSYLNHLVILLFHSNSDSWTCLNVTLYVHSLSCWRFNPTIKQFK